METEKEAETRPVVEVEEMEGGGDGEGDGDAAGHLGWLKVEAGGGVRRAKPRATEGGKPETGSPHTFISSLENAVCKDSYRRQCQE